ncbi:hypothetical protein QUY_0836 [Clostridioides difficile P71]|nr:hypothetical protein QUY_0836 [Clostridioides difficile P71]
MGIWLEYQIKKIWKKFMHSISERKVFYVLVVIGKKEKEVVEAILQEFTPELRYIYVPNKNREWIKVVND